MWQPQESNSCPTCKEYHSEERMAYTALKNSPRSVNSQGYSRKCFPCSRRTERDRSIHQCRECAGDLTRQFEAYFANFFLDSSFCNNIPPQRGSKQYKARLLQPAKQRSCLSNTSKNGTIPTCNLKC